LFESEQDAAAALAAANEGDGGSAAPVSGNEQAPAPATEVGTVEQGGAAPAHTPEDTFTNIDQLPPELQPLAKQLQGDYTRKTQEVAPFRAAIQQAGMTPEDAAEALAFVQALQDPDQLQALYEHLGSQFGNGGFDPAATGEDFGIDSQQGFEDDPNASTIAQLQQRLDRFEQQQVEAQASAELDRMEAVIRQQNPSFGDSDMQAIARLSIAHGGNLLQGAEDFKSLQQQIIAAHVGTKAAVPAGASGLPATGHAEQPTRFDSLDAAHEAALQMLAQDLAN
jgi:hypothetical protein